VRIDADGRPGSEGRRRRARLGAVAALGAALAALLGGCGATPANDVGPPETPEDAASAAHAALEAAGTFAFEATYVRTRADALDQPEEYGSSEGAVDLDEDAGRMHLRLIDIADLRDPIELRWDAEALFANIGGEARSVTRADAREDAGLIGRFPDEPAGLVALLTLARDPEEIGHAAIGGRDTTGYRFAVDRRAAGQVGVPVELSRALDAGNPEVRLTLEAWLDAGGVARRLAYVVHLAALHDDADRVILPARIVRATYDLRDFGAPVEVSVPAPDE
jgi:hypothetical protein